ncbi:hypothetical protein RIF29_38559 [Crotalaria pallida]|uniref:Uncharacterized protein n=1 Tax=Crotalaria pallida TaxID=3830 RepID=A0AAN9DZJ4_CROPI
MVASSKRNIDGSTNEKPCKAEYGLAAPAAQLDIPLPDGEVAPCAVVGWIHDLLSATLSTLLGGACQPS